MGKWKWVSEKLEELGFEDLSKEARKIHEHLVEIYGTEETEDWIYDESYINGIYEEDKKRNGIFGALCRIKDVVSTGKYCIACVSTPLNCMGYSDCLQCEYGKKYGRCTDVQDSEYKRFLKRLEKAIWGYRA